jgi:hypothetical protein
MTSVRYDFSPRAVNIPGTREAHTVQIKTIVNPFLDGGTGPLVVGWVLPRTCKAQWLAGVDLSRDRVWLFPIEDALRHARGNTADVMLYWHLESPRGSVVGVEGDFDQYRFDVVIDDLLGGRESQLGLSPRNQSSFIRR